MAAARYLDLVRDVEDAYSHRLRLVQFARHRGVKPTTRHFAITVATVRKCLPRYQQQGPFGLRDQGLAHWHCPH
jgi:Helix-turn-helix domain